jgi:hypothetical protein
MYQLLPEGSSIVHIPGNNSIALPWDSGEKQRIRENRLWYAPFEVTQSNSVNKNVTSTVTRPLVGLIKAPNPKVAMDLVFHFIRSERKHNIKVEMKQPLTAPLQGATIFACLQLGEDEQKKFTGSILCDREAALYEVTIKCYSRLFRVIAYGEGKRNIQSPSNASALHKFPIVEQVAKYLDSVSLINSPSEIRDVKLIPVKHGPRFLTLSKLSVPGFSKSPDSVSTVSTYQNGHWQYGEPYEMD